MTLFKLNWKNMRRPERIPIILDILKNDSNKKLILEYFFKPKEGEQIKLHEPYNDIDFHIKRWSDNFEMFSTGWKLMPELRLTQALVNSGILPNYPGFWYLKEDEPLMVDCKLLEPRDIYFWGQNYDKDLNRLDKTNYILIKDMLKEHIEAILLHVFNNEMKVSDKYVEYFSEELKLKKKK